LKVGVSLPQAGQQATSENVIQMAKNSESKGIDSLWVFERLLWPINPTCLKLMLIIPSST
jgi:hypothetical protein